MKIPTTETVDVTFDCDITIDEILHEFDETIDAASDEQWQGLGPVVDTITKMLARINDNAIKAFPQKAREEVTKRLAAEQARWADSLTSDAKESK